MDFLFEFTLILLPKYDFWGPKILALCRISRGFFCDSFSFFFFLVNKVSSVLQLDLCHQDWTLYKYLKITYDFLSKYWQLMITMTGFKY